MRADTGIRNIVFDLGRVLVDFEPERCLGALRFSEAARQVFREKIFGDVWAHCDRIPYDDYEIRVLFKQQVPGFEAEVDRMWDEKLPDISRVMPFTEEWLKVLKTRGFSLYILSNYGKRSFEINSPKYGFLSLTDGQLISYEVQLLKPEPEIYECLCTRFGIRPKESIFVDDRPVNVEAAEKLGFRGIVFRNYRQARDRLEEIVAEQKG